MVVVDINSARSPLQYALRYARIGWYVLPLQWAVELEVDGAKTWRCSCGNAACRSPAKHPIHQLVPKGLADATILEEVIRRWFTQFPRANIGIAMQASNLVAVDIDPRNGGIETMNALEDDRGRIESDVLAYTGGGGEHRIFTVASGQQLPGSLGAGIDIKLNGYIVVEPSIHISGRTYEWEASSDPLDGAAPSALPDWLRSFTPSRRSSDEPQAARAHIAPDQEAKIRSALAAISNVDEREAWLEIGMALHSTGAGPQAYGIWTDWARQSEKFSPRDQMYTWRHFYSDRGLNNLTLASIFSRAQEVGWVNPDSGAAQRAREKLERDQEITELLAAKVKPEPVVKPAETLAVEPFPVAVLNDAWRWVQSSTNVRHPLISQGAVLAMYSTAASRRYVSSVGGPVHLLICATGPATDMLDYSIDATRQALEAAGMREAINTTLSSPAQLFEALYHCPASILLFEDYGGQVKTMHSQHGRTVERMLTIIGGEVYRGVIQHHAWSALGLKADPNPSTDGPKRHACTIYAPAMTVLGLASGSQLVNVFQKSQLARGAISRMLIISGSDPNEWSRSWVGKNDPLTPEITEHLRALRGFAPGATELGHEGVMQSIAGTIPTPIRVLSGGNLQRHVEGLWSASHKTWVDYQILANGAAENLIRIAALIAIAANPVAPNVTDDIADWAARFVRKTLERTANEYRVKGSDSERRSVADAVLDVVHDHGRDGITPSDLAKYCRPFRALDSEARSKLTDTLVEDGAVFVIKAPAKSGGRPLRRIVAERFIEQPGRTTHEPTSAGDFSRRPTFSRRFSRRFCRGLKYLILKRKSSVLSFPDAEYGNEEVDPYIKRYLLSVSVGRRENLGDPRQ